MIKYQIVNRAIILIFILAVLALAKVSQQRTGASAQTANVPDRPFSGFESVFVDRK